MKRVVSFALWLTSDQGWCSHGPATANDPQPPTRPTVQIAILLDTSDSMDGLIGQAKTQLWNVVNEFIRARKNGRPPAIQVALFEYGKNVAFPAARASYV